MSNYKAGHDAEVRAAEYLKAQGFKIRELNWKTRYCEIDIVAEKDGSIYFVEVKYRRTTNQGYGMDYITAKKLRQMRFAAELWIQANGWTGDCELAAASVDGQVITFIEGL